MKELCCRKSEEAIKNGQYRDTSNIFKMYKDKDCQEKIISTIGCFVTDQHCKHYINRYITCLYFIRRIFAIAHRPKTTCSKN